MLCLDLGLQRIVNMCECKLEIMSAGLENSRRNDQLEHISLQCHPPFTSVSFTRFLASVIYESFDAEAATRRGNQDIQSKLLQANDIQMIHSSMNLLPSDMWCVQVDKSPQSKGLPSLGNINITK